MVPGLEDLLFQHNLGDLVLGRPVVHISKCQLSIAKRDRKIASLVAHCLGRMRAPFRVL